VNKTTESYLRSICIDFVCGTHGFLLPQILGLENLILVLPNHFLLAEELTEEYVELQSYLR